MPEWHADVRRRLDGLAIPAARKDEIAEELIDHLDDRYREHVARGRSSVEATRLALAELSEHGVLARELGRLPAHAGGPPAPRRRAVVGLLTDARQALRVLGRYRSQTAVLVLTLGLGMAATTTIYAIFDAVVVRPLPYERSSRLVAAGTLLPGRTFRADAPRLQQLAGASVADVADWEARTSTVETMVPVELVSLLVQGPSGPELVNGARAGQGFFDLVDAQPALGRLFVASDYENAKSAVTVVSHATWQQRYGGDPDVVGRTVGGLTIVGVLDADFTPPEAVIFRTTEFWSALVEGDSRYADRGRRSAVVLGLLAEGATVETAREELAAVQAALNDEYPEGHVYPDGTEMSAGLNPLHAETVGSAGVRLQIFLAAAGLLLAIACLNAVNLLLVRGLDRRGELAVRRALGAGRWHLLRGALFESLWLALAAGAVGMSLAYGGVALFLRFGPDGLPRIADVAVNGRVLLASAVASIGAGVLVALLPAWRAAGSAAVDAGLQCARAQGASASGSRLRTALVVGQLSAATVLAICAGLLIASLLNVASRDVGFEPGPLATFQVAVKTPPSPEAYRGWDELAREVASVAGVDAVAIASDPPYRNPSWAPGIRFPGEPSSAVRTGNFGFVVTPSYLDAVGGRLVTGRWLDATDGPTSQPVAIVNETFVREHLAGRDPIGVVLVSGPDGEAAEWTVVGVVADIVQRRVEDAARPAVYRPHTQEAWPFPPRALVRSARTDEGFFDELRAASARAYPGMPVIEQERMGDRIGATQLEPRFRAMLVGTFAVMALLLASVGLYGSLAQSVRWRSRELGIRMALGADLGRIAGAVGRQGVVVYAWGLAIGLAGAVLATRLVEGFLFEITAFDPIVYVAAAAVLAIATALAVWPSARLATRIDVVRSLRPD